jgi:hypothetical protein
MNTETTFENKIECILKLTRGFVLKADLRTAIQASSMKVLRSDVEQFVSLKPENMALYKGYEKKHSVSRSFAKAFLEHLFEDCKIIYTN